MENIIIMALLLINNDRLFGIHVFLIVIPVGVSRINPEVLSLIQLSEDLQGQYTETGCCTGKYGYQIFNNGAAPFTVSYHYQTPATSQYHAEDTRVVCNNHPVKHQENGLYQPKWSLPTQVQQRKFIGHGHELLW